MMNGAQQAQVLYLQTLSRFTALVMVFELRGCVSLEDFSSPFNGCWKVQEVSVRQKLSFLIFC